MLHQVYIFCLYIYLYMADWLLRYLKIELTKSIAPKCCVKYCKTQSKRPLMEFFLIKLQQRLRYGENLNKCFVEAQNFSSLIILVLQRKIPQTIFNKHSQLSSKQIVCSEKVKNLRSPKSSSTYNFSLIFCKHVLLIKKCVQKLFLDYLVLLI